MDIRKQDLEIYLEERWRPAIQKAASDFNSFQRIRFTKAIVEEDRLKIGSVDTCSFVQWLPDSLSEFDRYRFRATLLSSIEKLANKKSQKGTQLRELADQWRRRN